MIPLKIYAGGHAAYLEALKIKLRDLIKKINRDPKLSPAEKADARQEAVKSIQRDKRESLKNCY